MDKDKLNPIGLKKVELLWKDTTTVKETDQPENEHLQTVSTCGYLVSESEEELRYCVDYIKDSDITVYRQLTIIPKVLIVKREEF
jgi:hypothetical protein